MIFAAAAAGRAARFSYGVLASQWIKRRNAPPKPLVFQCRLLAMDPVPCARPAAAPP